MAVYVDNEQIPWKGKLWCHLVADTLDELHAFALQIGLKRTWFQEKASYPHYDVTAPVRLKAIKSGAVVADRLTMLNCAKKIKVELLSK